MSYPRNSVDFVVAFEDKVLFHPRSPAEWEAFLENDPPGDGVRLQLRKKNSTKPGILWGEALDVALCFGWIDGMTKRLDDDYTLQSFTPRRPRSMWSQINREHIARLTAEGRMRPSGQAEVDRAKADGRWDAAYRVKDLAVPPEMQAALDASPEASRFFDSLRKQDRTAFLFPLLSLKRADTRERRVREYIALLEQGETLG